MGRVAVERVVEVASEESVLCKSRMECYNQREGLIRRLYADVSAPQVGVTPMCKEVRGLMW